MFIKIAAIECDILDKHTVNGAAQYLRNVLQLRRCDAIVVDVDGGLINDHLIDTGERYRLIEDVLGEVIGVEKNKPGREHYKHAQLLTQVYIECSEKYTGGATQSLRYILEHMGTTKCIDSETLYALAKKRIEEREVPGAAEFFNYLKLNRLRMAISTLGSDTGASAAGIQFGCTIYVANPITIYTDPLSGLDMVTGCEILMSTPEERLALTERLLNDNGTSLERSAVIGFDMSDLPMLQKAGFPIAAPGADKELESYVELKIPGGPTGNYEPIVHELKSCIPPYSCGG